MVQAWTEPDEWQQPRGGQRLHAVDVDSGGIRLSTELPHMPNELTGVEG